MLSRPGCWGGAADGHDARGDVSPRTDCEASAIVVASRNYNERDRCRSPVLLSLSPPKRCIRSKVVASTSTGRTHAPRRSRKRQRRVSAARRCLKAAIFSTMAHLGRRQYRSSGTDISLPSRARRSLCFIAEFASIKVHCVRVIDCAAKPQCPPMRP